jgi:hypothetical protein
MRKFILISFIISLALSLFHVIPPNDTSAEESWKQEYAAICAKTQNSMDLSFEELSDYVERCDILLEQINDLNETAGGSEKKVYTRRVEMCRNLYKYVLDYKNKNK